MTNETGKDAIRHFYIRVLLSDDYIEEVDYKKIKKDDDLIKIYEKFCLTNINDRKNKNKAKQGAKKYYAITKNTYHKILEKRKILNKTIKYPEKKISDRLARELNGKRAVLLKCGKRIDIITDNELIEVKSYQNRLSSIGQLLYYSKFYDKLQKRLYLFDHKNNTDTTFNEICDELNIKITYE